MAIFSASIGVIGRSKGKQACAAAAYQSRESIYDKRQGQRFSYRNREGEALLATELMLPEGAPQWDRQTLWNSVESSERRKDAQTARTIRLALPRELDLGQLLQLTRSFLKRHFVDRSLAVDFAVHDKEACDGGRQPHVHALVTLRRLSAEGFSRKKDRETFRNPASVIAFRKAWADAINTALRSADIDAAVDHRSIADQRTEVETLLATPGLELRYRLSLRAGRIALLREPESKVPAWKWRVARGRNDLPQEVERARQSACEAIGAACEMLELIEDLNKSLEQETGAPCNDSAENGTICGPNAFHLDNLSGTSGQEADAAHVSSPPDVRTGPPGPFGRR